MEVYKVMRRDNGKLCSATVLGGMKTYYVKNQAYDLVFAFTTIESAVRFMKPRKDLLEIWKCTANEAFAPQHILGCHCADCSTWPKSVLEAIFLGREADFGTDYCQICGFSSEHGTPVVIACPAFLEGTVVCRGLVLEKQLVEV